MHILEGIYDMSLYYPDIDGNLKCVASLISEKDFYYEMMDRKAQHYVRPIGGICKTVMLTGKPIWKENDMITNKILIDLSEERKTEILNYYKEYYGEKK